MYGSVKPSLALIKIPNLFAVLSKKVPKINLVFEYRVLTPSPFCIVLFGFCSSRKEFGRTSNLYKGLPRSKMPSIFRNFRKKISRISKVFTIEKYEELGVFRDHGSIMINGKLKICNLEIVNHCSV